MSAGPPVRPCPPTPFLAGFESTYLPVHDVDITETTRHDAQWEADLAGLPASVRQVRYPIRWHRVEAEPGRYDWSGTDRALERLREQGVSPVVDLVHHTSYPRWLTDGFRDPRFGPAYVRFAERVAGRYPWLEAYTLFNEPFSTLHFAGHDALWPPYDSGTEGFVRLLTNVLPALSEAAACWRALLPGARHVWVDTCEHHAAAPGSRAEAHVAMANDRRHVVLDLALGHDLDPGRPYLQQLLRAGAEPLLTMPGLEVDVLGLDYYPAHEWWYDDAGGHAPSPRPVGFAALAELYAARYGRDLMLTETNVRGLPSDRASWLRYTLEQYELAVARGVPLRGYCWYPLLDSADWDSLLARAAGRVDPVGVVSIESDGRRVETVFTRAWRAAASGARAADLPAYRFQPPLAERLRGFLPQMAHWDWMEPPAGATPRPVLIDDKENPVPLPSSSPSTGRLPAAAPPGGDPVPDLVVLSHLRWTWVWQRPQHLVSRFAARRAGQAARTWFVEEPVPAAVAEPRIRTEQRDGVVRVWLEVPDPQAGPRTAFDERLGFDDPAARSYPELLVELLQREGRPAHPDVLLYTPMALELAEALEPARLAYDVMDDLAAFKDAPEGMRLRQRRLLAEAHTVFAGGRSLHRSVSAHRPDAHLFPSGVDLDHYARAVRLRQPRKGPVAGYVGVIDERLDLDLLAGLAAALPSWTLQVVGPVAKIEPASLPQGANLHYPGQVAYADLPEVMAGFDVALMPFALNEATRSISPTKTLEYLAAGLPVVSTRVPDVVAGYAGTVHFADDAASFAAGCREVLHDPVAERELRIRHIKQRQSWDSIAARMGELLRPASRPLPTTTGATA